MVTDLQRVRLSKLLAVAKDNPNAAEAAVALLKAQELLAEPETEAADSSAQAVVTMWVSRDITDWNRLLAQAIADNFRVYTVIEGDLLSFLGMAQDVAVARDVYRAAREAALRASYEHWIRHLDESADEQASFLRGFAVGLRRQYQQQVQERGYLPMLQKPPEVEAYVLQIGFEQDTVVVPHLNTSGYSEGVEAGGSYRSPLRVVEQADESD